MKVNEPRTWILATASVFTLVLLFGFQNCAPVLPLDGVVDASSIAVRPTATPGPTSPGTVGSNEPTSGGGYDGTCVYENTSDLMAINGTDLPQGALLAFSHPDGRVAFWNLTAAGNSVARGIVCRLTGYSVVAIGDFDGDFNQDVLWRSSAGALVLWRMRGVTRLETSLLSMVAPPTMSLEGVGDFNLDGTKDLLWRDSASSPSGKVWITFMNRLLAPTNSSQFDLPSGAHILTVGYFSAQPFADIVWTSAAGVPGVTRNVATDSARTNTEFASGIYANATIIGVGDFDGDGKSDFLIRRTDNQKYALRLMTEMALRTQTGDLEPPDATWAFQFMADLNGGVFEWVYTASTTTGTYLKYISASTSYTQTTLPNPIQSGFVLFKYPHL